MHSLGFKEMLILNEKHIAKQIVRVLHLGITVQFETMHCIPFRHSDESMVGIQEHNHITVLAAIGGCTLLK